MRRPLTLLTTAALAAACAGHSAPAASPTPAAARQAAPPRDPSTLRYAFGSSRYHSVTEVAQEVMGQAQNFDAHVYLSAVSSAAGPNVGVAVTLDSLSTTAPGAEGLAGVQGHSVNLVFSPTGQPVSMTSPDTANPTILQLAEGLRELLPRLPNGPIAAGTTWSDTTTRRVPAPEANLSMTLARQHQVVGWEDHDGVRALHVTTTGSYTLTGSGEAQGQMLEFSGTGHNVAEHYVSSAGIYLGSASADTADINVNVVSAGMQVSVRRMQRATVTRLP